MLHVLQMVAIDYKWFSFTVGSSTRHELRHRRQLHRWLYRLIFDCARIGRPAEKARIPSRLPCSFQGGRGDARMADDGDWKAPDSKIDMEALGDDSANTLVIINQVYGKLVARVI